MKADIDVENRREAQLIRAGLALPDVRAIVKIAGALAPLPERSKRRVLAFVSDLVKEELDMKRSGGDAE